MSAADYARRHVTFGWWSLLVFLTLGIVLETLHGLKIGWYLNVANESRRLMITLAHAHGTLLALVHLAFAATACDTGYGTGVRDTREGGWRRVASPCLVAASVLLPAGFLLGGLFVYGGDPGLGVLLVPVGAALLLVAVALVARAASATAGKDRGSS
jgi:hypothetical protein